MKTTVEIADQLFAEVRESARREGTSFRVLVEEGLRLSLARRRQPTSYRWPDLSFGGEGLQPGVAEGRWESLRDLSREAPTARVPRSAVVREAPTDFVARKARESFMTEFVAAAKSLARSPEESLAVAEELLPLENEALEISERKTRKSSSRSGHEGSG